jgi:hypothetical protein
MTSKQKGLLVLAVGIPLWFGFTYVWENCCSPWLMHVFHITH